MKDLTELADAMLRCSKDADPIAAAHRELGITSFDECSMAGDTLLALRQRMREIDGLMSQRIDRAIDALTRITCMENSVSWAECASSAAKIFEPDMDDDEEFKCPEDCGKCRVNAYKKIKKILIGGNDGNGTRYSCAGKDAS